MRSHHHNVRKTDFENKGLFRFRIFQRTGYDSRDQTEYVSEINFWKSAEQGNISINKESSTFILLNSPNKVEPTDLGTFRYKLCWLSRLSFDKNNGSLFLSFLSACDDAQLSLSESALLHQFCPIFPPKLSYLLEIQFGFLIQIPRPQNKHFHRKRLSHGRINLKST
jgi:hypothetical protein